MCIADIINLEFQIDSCKLIIKKERDLVTPDIFQLNYEISLHLYL